MAPISTAADTDGLPCSTLESLPDLFRMPDRPISKDAAYQIISDELMRHGNPRLNLASSVTPWMEPECDKLIMQAINNYVEMDDYPVTTELQNRCVKILANLFKAPFDDGKEPAGVGTVGSSEAIMLAGLAFKRKWQKKREDEKKPFDKPNIVIGANVQACWEKFARYFEVKLNDVKLKEGCYVMDPAEAVKMVDENTICVVAVLGSPYNGQFEDVKDLNDRLVDKNNETGWETPIHVDATDGGFIAPFLHPDLKWDFRLPLVRSINVSGQKYGLVHPRVGWVIWKTKQDLPEELIFPISCLDADGPTFTLNSCKGASQIIAQYYQFIRLGLEGYRNAVCHCAAIAKDLTTDLLKTDRFNLLSENVGVSLVAFSLKDGSRYDEYEISDRLRRLGWVVPADRMAPDAQHVKFLRVAIRQDFSRSLVRDIEKVLQELDALPRKPVGEVMPSSLESHPQLEENTDMQPFRRQEPGALSPKPLIEDAASTPKFDSQTPDQVGKKRGSYLFRKGSLTDSGAPRAGVKIPGVESSFEDQYEPPHKKQKVAEERPRAEDRSQQPVVKVDVPEKEPASQKAWQYHGS